MCLHALSVSAYDLQRTCPSGQYIIWIYTFLIAFKHVYISLQIGCLLVIFVPNMQR